MADSTKVKIEVELLELDGFEYTGEYRRAEPGEWYLDSKNKINSNPNSLITCYEYLIIIPQEPESLKDRIKAQYPDYDVVMLKENEVFDLVLNAPGLPLHCNAQSMKHFHRYVYEGSESGFYDARRPTDSNMHNKTILPCAVLFSRGEEG